MKVMFEGTRNVLIDGATQNDILAGPFRNFRGEKRKYNDEGKRNFNLALPEDVAQELANRGANVKVLESRDEGEEPLRFIKVNVAFGKYPPQLYLVNSKKKIQELREDQLALLDAANFSNVDLIIRQYHKDEESTSLYLQKGYFTLREDPITAKYSDYNPDCDVEDEETELPFD